MKPNLPIKIVAMGKYLPRKVSSAELEQKHGLPAGWSERYSGVANRHFATDETVARMGVLAVEDAFKKTDLNLGDIDLLISAGFSYDYPLPNQACVLKSELKNGHKYHFPAICIDMTCLSFVAALEYAAAVIDGEKYKRILIVNSEKSSVGLDPKNPETLTLFGDAAVATILEYDPSCESRVVKSLSKTYSEGVYHTMIPGGGLKNHFKDYPYDPSFYAFQMEGKKLLRLAKKLLPEFFGSFFGELPITIQDVDVIVPHQASKIGISILRKLYDLEPSRVKSSLHKYGNCIASSIPLTLLDTIEAGEIKRGDTCLLIGTSAGFSIGGALIKY